MASAPHRSGLPLQVFGRTHAVVFSHGVIAGVVQVMGPIVDIFGDRLAERACD